jgi:translocation and assembly module TamA
LAPGAAVGRAAPGQPGRKLKKTAHLCPMNRKWLWGIVGAMWLLGPSAAAQGRWQLQVRTPAGEPPPRDPKASFNDSLELVGHLRALVARWHQAGYLLARTDSLHFARSAAAAPPARRPDSADLATSVIGTAWLTVGPLFSWVALRPGNLDPALARRVGFQERHFRGRPLRYAHYARLARQVLAFYQNNGYPFASVRLDSLQINTGQVAASLRVERGSYIRLDSLIVDGDVKIKPSFLKSLLRWQPDQPFSQTQVDQALRTLRTLPYLQLRRPPEVVFRLDRAYLYVQGAPKRASQFDGVVGLLPNQERPGQLLLTGQASLRLRNLFGSGKAFNLEWQRFRAGSQLLNADYEHPNLLNTRVDVGLRLNLLREDTAFLNLVRGIQLAYPLGGRARRAELGRVSFFARVVTTTVTDTARNPEPGVARFANTQLTAYGLGYEFSAVDEPLRPQRGWLLRTEVWAGNKQVRPLAGQPSTDAFVGSSAQGAATAQLSRYWRTGKNTTLLLRATGGILWNQNLFLNELFRFGGLASLRGFNENTFFASRYAIATAEYRLYFEELSYLFAFVDQGAWAYQVPGQARRDTPLGFGAGLHVGVRGGVFTFAYALGRASFPQQAFTLNQSKIHFGYVSRF